MNLFQVKQDQIVKIIDLKKGDQYQDKNDPVLERLELLGFRVGESLYSFRACLIAPLRVLAQTVFQPPPSKVNINSFNFIVFITLIFIT